MGKKYTGFFNSVLILCCVSLIVIAGCKVDSSNATGYGYDQNKVMISVPDDIEADIYEITISSGSNFFTYNEIANSKQIMVSVPVDIESQVDIAFYKENTRVAAGIATIAPGQTDGIEIDFGDSSEPFEISELPVHE